MIVSIRVEHLEAGPGHIVFTGVTEQTDGKFDGDHPAVYALLPRGMPESYDDAAFLPDHGDDGYRLERDEFTYDYQAKALWIVFRNGIDDTEPMVFRILEIGSEAA